MPHATEVNMAAGSLCRKVLHTSFLNPFRVSLGRNGRGVRNFSTDQEPTGGYEDPQHTEIESKIGAMPNDERDSTSIKCLNEVKLLGFVGADPRELVNTFKPMVYFPLATNRFFRNEFGELQKHTTWHSILVRRYYLMEYTKKSLRKGYRAYVSGSIGDSINIDGGRKTFIIADQVISLMQNLPKDDPDLKDLNVQNDH
ncbi:UNVERIFIED_CONTAM: hypothetical protein PYX00_005872 [Menopon gallinae]|uniref:Uncharacterized protein n=1 Tax=Menopon gallinae TaxID=328185 RepID=A0AAW2HU86_9NEOP